MRKILSLLVIISFILMPVIATAKTIEQKTNEATIKGVVEEAVTCIPSPLPDATVIAKSLNLLNPERYETKTSLDGTYELKIPAGNYRIFVEKDKYKSSVPRIGYIETINSDETYDFSFKMLPSPNRKGTTIDDSYTNLTVQETWELIKTSSNGIQILIDVRTKEEYQKERIYTPSVLEKPRLYPLQWLEDESLLQSFISLYDGKEIILYCRSANRSFIATEILIENNFNGKIYNMVGGIKEWKNEGLPTVKGKEKPLILENNLVIFEKIIQLFPIFERIFVS